MLAAAAWLCDGQVSNNGTKTGTKKDSIIYDSLSRKLHALSDIALLAIDGGKRFHNELECKKKSSLYNLVSIILF
jgi:hypothetical protein